MTGSFDGVIWRGVYLHFSEVPSPDSPWEGEWLERSRARADSGGGDGAESLLPVVAAIACRDRPVVRVLDFGGGLAFAYEAMTRGLPGDKGLLYDLVDHCGVTAAAAERLRGRDGIGYHVEVPDRDYDVVHCGSSLHYVGEWKVLLGRLAERCRQYLLIADLPIGQIATFVTTQAYYGHRIPVWFFNETEFSKELTALGFRLVHRRAVRGTTDSQNRPMCDLPEDHVPDSFWDLLYERDVDRLARFAAEDGTL